VTSVKHATRKPLPAASAVAAEQRSRNRQLRNLFPPRSVEEWWPATAATAEQVRHRLTSGPFVAAAEATRAGRRRGVAKLLDWLSTFPGDTWQARWLAGGAEQHPGAGWVSLPTGWLATAGEAASYDSTDLSAGLLMLICGDVIRPGLPWMLTRTHRYLAAVMALVRDPDGFARLRELADAEPAASQGDAKIAATRIATLMACKGGGVADVTVGDCVELVETMRRVHTRGGQKKVDFYLRLRALGVFPGDAPHSIRAFGLAGGKLTIEQLVDRYRIQCRPIRDLLVDYLRERQPSLDFVSLDAISRTLAGLFWARVEALAPGIDSLRLPPAVVRAWKEELSTVIRTTTDAAGERIQVSTPRLNAKDELMRVRALYLDIAQWAVEDPARWAAWVAPCPISGAEVQKAKERRHRKARMDQRTRERLPVLPVLVRTAKRPAPGGRPPPGRGAGRRTGRGHRRRRRDTPKGHRPHGHRAACLGRGPRHGQAAQPVPRGRGGVLGVRHHRSPTADRHPLRGTARAQPPQRHRIPAAGYRRAGAAAADRAVQDRHRTATAGQSRAGRRPRRHRQASARPRRGRPIGGRLRRPGEGLAPADAAAVPAGHRQRASRVHALGHPEAAHQRARGDRTYRRQR